MESAASPGRVSRRAQFGRERPPVLGRWSAQTPPGSASGRSRPTCARIDDDIELLTYAQLVAFIDDYRDIEDEAANDIDDDIDVDGNVGLVNTTLFGSRASEALAPAIEVVIVAEIERTELLAGVRSSPAPSAVSNRRPTAAGNAQSTSTGPPVGILQFHYKDIKCLLR